MDSCTDVSVRVRGRTLRPLRLKFLSKMVRLAMNTTCFLLNFFGGGLAARGRRRPPRGRRRGRRRRGQGGREAKSARRGHCRWRGARRPDDSARRGRARLHRAHEQAVPDRAALLEVLYVDSLAPVPGALDRQQGAGDGDA